MRIERDQAYSTSGGAKVIIVAQMPPDTNGCRFVGTVQGNGSALYRVNGVCPANDDLTLVSPWVSDSTIYQPMKIRADGSGIVVGDLYADIDVLKAKNPDCQYICKTATESGVPELTVIPR